MPYEFHLEPAAGGEFDAEALSAMHGHVSKLPVHQWPDQAYTLFSSDEERARDLPAMLVATGNDYVHAIIAIEPTEVLLSLVGDLVSNRMIHDFVIWCSARWPCALFEYSERVEPDILLRAGY